MSYYKADSVRQAVSGNWLFVLDALAPHLEPSLRKPGRHVACPVHGGRDGFRLFKDAHLTGGGVCNTCGIRHDGFELLMWLNGWNFKQCLDAVGNHLGVAKTRAKYPLPYQKTAGQVIQHAEHFPVLNRKVAVSVNKEKDLQAKMAIRENGAKVVPLFNEQPKSWLLELQKDMQTKTEREQAYSARLHEKIEKLWNGCLPFSSSSAEPMRLYLQNRELLFRGDEVEKSDCIRFHPALSYYDGEGSETGKFPAIVCAIRDREGKLVTLHRTYLAQTGKKAKVSHAKKMMPVPQGLDVNGAAIRLGEPSEGILGVAEGLETALSAYRITKVPVWSTVNATLMESFEVPESVHTVLIWADKDKSATGEKSANVLKARLEKRGIRVYVLLPKLPIPPRAKGIDWNDVLISQGRLGFPSARYLRDFIARMRAEGDREAITGFAGHNPAWRGA